MLVSNSEVRVLAAMGTTICRGRRDITELSETEPEETQTNTHVALHVHVRALVAMRFV